MPERRNQVHMQFCFGCSKFLGVVLLISVIHRLDSVFLDDCKTAFLLAKQEVCFRA